MSAPLPPQNSGQPHAEPDDLAPVFVVGAARSGTTLLQQMLDHHPNLAFPWESHFVPFFDRWLPLYGDLARVENRHRLIADIERYVRRLYPPVPGREEEWVPGLAAEARRLAEASGPDYASVLDTLYRFAVRDRAPCRWCDKTPLYVNSMPALHRLFPGARFIHIIRDGRDVAASVVKLTWGPNSFLAAARKWKRSVQNGLAFAERHPGIVFTLHYEELIDDPETKLREICAFLGEEYSPAMLEYHKDASSRVPDLEIHQRLARPVNKERMQRWKKDLAPDQLRVYEAVAGDLLERLGYERALPEARLTRGDRLRGQMAHLTRLFKQENPAQRFLILARLMGLGCRHPLAMLQVRSQEKPS